MFRRALSTLLSLALTAAPIAAHADEPTAAAPTTVSLVVPSFPASHVHLTGENPGLTLDRRSGVTTRSGLVVAEEWRAICAAPCDAELPADGLYRVSAPDTEPQYLPHLHGQDAEVSADLRGSSAASIGIAFILGGVGALTIGTGLLISESMRSSEDKMFGHSNESVSYAPGIVTLSLSLPLMIVGGIIAASGQGSLTVSTHDPMPTLSLGEGVGLSPAGLVF